MCLGLDLLKSQSKVSNDCVCFTIMSLLSYGHNRSNVTGMTTCTTILQFAYCIFLLPRHWNVIAQNDGDKETLGNLKAHKRQAFIINVDCYLAYKNMENSFARQFGTQ